ncbi:MAG TPA: lactate racemase domain-containing protein [Gaiellaceae bacterium]|nr:lactate racemase domain-containing protein [Gaiellaceae bacterium]
MPPNRVPLLAGSRLRVVEPPDDAVVLRSPAPREALADVGAAVRDALRFPLAGRPLEEVVRRGGRATIVVEPPALPIPSAVRDPRLAALAAAVGELERNGIPLERQTLLVAGGLTRRPEQRELEHVVPPELARRFSGRVEIHDAERPDLVGLEHDGRVPLRVNPALVETDLVVVVSAAETLLHGGPAALLAAAGPEAIRAAQASSLVESSGSPGWRLAVELERALVRRVPVIASAVTLNPPAVTGAFHGYPHDSRALERIAASPVRLLFRAVPGIVRNRLLASIPRDLTATAVFGGPPSVAHVEALLRGVDARSARLAEPLDVAVVGVPPTTPHLPRERPNPVLVAYLALGLALRLWRDRFPIAEGGSAILLHPFDRRFPHPSQLPYRTFFGALRNLGTRAAREPASWAAAEEAAAEDERAIRSYREGRSCHPLLPFADWAACLPAFDRLGTVFVADCRDAYAARQFGFVPTRSLAAALGMARARVAGEPRIGYFVAPPYFPVSVRS